MDEIIDNKKEEVTANKSDKNGKPKIFRSRSMENMNSKNNLNADVDGVSNPS